MLVLKTKRRSQALTPQPFFDIFLIKQKRTLKQMFRVRFYFIGIVRGIYGLSGDSSAYHSSFSGIKILFASWIPT